MLRAKIFILVLVFCSVGAEVRAASVVRFDWEAMITNVNATQAMSSQLPASIQVGETVSGSIFYDPTGTGVPFGTSFTRYSFPVSAWTLKMPGVANYTGSGVTVDVANNNAIGLDTLDFSTTNGLTNGDWTVVVAVRDFEALIFDDESLVTDFSQQTFDNELEYRQISIYRYWDGVIYSNPIDTQFTAFSIVAVPEPSSFALLGMLAAGVVVRRSRPKSA